MSATWSAAPLSASSNNSTTSSGTLTYLASCRSSLLYSSMISEPTTVCIFLDAFLTVLGVLCSIKTDSRFWLSSSPFSFSCPSLPFPLSLWELSVRLPPLSLRLVYFYPLLLKKNSDDLLTLYPPVLISSIASAPGYIGFESSGSHAPESQSRSAPTVHSLYDDKTMDLLHKSQSMDEGHRYALLSLRMIVL